MSDSFQPCGVISLTTDFGHKGPFIGTMKGFILTRFPGARIVDLTHEILVHWPAEAGFWIARSYHWFPEGTVHVAVVDPGVGTDRDIILVLHDGHAFLAPDNGLLGTILEKQEAPVLHRLDKQRFAALGIDKPSATFHGRDIFAPLAAALAGGTITAGDIGPRSDSFVPGWLEAPEIRAKEVRGTVISVDHFGNLITNIEAEMIENLASPIVKVSGHEVPLRSTYGEAPPGDYLALINSFDVLEVARAEKSAADGLGMGRGAPVIVRTQQEVLV